MQAEFGKYYELSTDKFYFCVDLQRSVKFDSKLVVKCGSSFKEMHFGNLVDLCVHGPFGVDYDTKHEIEFTDEDIISEYEKFQPKPIVDYFFKEPQQLQ